jgi:radical SAM superfamily enzyme YgiQ (UPF0313 family)
MKVLFVNSNLMQKENISLGIAYLSSYIKQRGHKSELVDYTWGGTVKDCLDKINGVNPDIVGFSPRTGEISFCFSIAEKIKRQYPDMPIIFGGVHPTVAPDETIHNEFVDMVCIGDGENALAELLDKLENNQDISKIKNIWLKNNGQIIRNDICPLIEEVDSLPFPDRELFDYERYLDSNAYDGEVMASRGCPYNCSYCINSTLRERYKDKGVYVRTRNAESVIKEIGLLNRKYKIERITFHDEMFTVNKKWLREFSYKYSSSFSIPFMCNARVETLDSEVCDLLKSAGCSSLNVGVEAGNPEIRKNVLNRHMSNETIIKGFKTAKSKGLRIYAYNMIGIPHETVENINETIELNRLIQPDDLQATIFQPYPGTRLYDLCKEKGWIKDGQFPVAHRMEPLTSYPHISSKKLVQIQKYFRFHVLRKYNIRKALISLLFDLNYNLYIRFRTFIPKSLKKLLFKISWE